MSSYINLNLIKVGEQPSNLYDVESAIKETGITVILGAPGSGKSSLLQLFKEKNETVTVYRSFQDFDIDFEIDDNAQYLLLDGLDEFRNAQRDNKTGILKKTAFKIKKINKEIKVVIACREMDWLGNTDEDALKNYLQENVQVFILQPLNAGKRLELVNNLGIKQIDESFEKFIVENELFDNPQILKMFVEVYNESGFAEIETKADLFKYYIDFSREHNEENRQNAINAIEPDLYEKIAGYMAYYYMFANVKSYDDDICEKICDASRGYTLNDIKSVTRSKLLHDGTFAHRMIAEYLAAKYLYEEKIKKDHWPISRMKALLTNGENIVFSEYRGIYAWLCFFSKDQELIEVDPYLQYQYGDNSLFANEDKLKIIQAIRKYSDTKPYFMKYGDSQKAETLAWDGDEKVLIPLYRECWDKKNHFLHFLNSILLCHSENPCDELKNFANEVICRKELDSYYKCSLLIILRDNSNQLLHILELINNGNIEDDRNELKDEILGWLYPQNISLTDLKTYIQLYNPYQVFCDRFSYLQNTPNERLKDVLEALFPCLASLKEVNLERAYENLLSKYFANLLRNESEENFWKEVACYSGKLKCNHVYWNAMQSALEKNLDQEKREKLYATYLLLTTPREESEEKVCYARKLAIIGDALKIKPQSSVCVIEELLRSTKSDYFRERVVQEITRDYDIFDFSQLAEMKKKLQEWAKQYNLEGTIGLFLEDIDKTIKESHRFNGNDEFLQEVRANVEENEKFIARLTYVEKRNNFDILNACSGYYLHHLDQKYSEADLRITEKTYKDFCDILKNLFVENLDENRIFNGITTLKYMAENTPMQSRAVDYIYTAMLVLNDDYDFSTIADEDVGEYFYIISIMNNRISGIRQSCYDQFYERHDLKRAVDVLKKFFEYFVKTLDADDASKSILLNTVLSDDDGKKTLSRMKSLLHFIPQNKNERYKNLLERFLNEYALQLELDDLNNIEIDDESLALAINSLKVLKNMDESMIDKSVVLQLYQFIGNNLNCLKAEELFFYIKAIFDIFKDESTMIERCGIIDSEQSLAMDLRYSFLNKVNGKRGLDVLKLLLEHGNVSEYWENRIKTRISELQEEIIENESHKMTIEKAKEYIFNKTYVNEIDFWKDVCDKLDSIKREIEDNRDNQKDAYFQDANNPKEEESCRDNILIKWNDKYSMIAKATKEKYEADNRVDINLQCLMGIPAEVQIECKKDENRQLKTGIADQLVEKYLNKENVNYGVYLVFNFKKDDPEAMVAELATTIPHGYENKIDVKYIDLRY